MKWKITYSDGTMKAIIVYATGWNSLQDQLIQNSIFFRDIFNMELVLKVDPENITDTTIPVEEP